jgi:cell fate regulator YaaT (PSP1 superfamily)
MISGMGPCGKCLCCSTFLGDFAPVSIKMAKEQNLSLNPTKISGICGRLMCCLKYEHETYENSRKYMPKIGALVDTPEGRGEVVESNVLMEKVKVRLELMEANLRVIKDYSVKEIVQLKPGKDIEPAIEGDLEHLEQLEDN